jgi:hypothetical protein
MIVQPARTALRTASNLNAQGHPILAAGAALGALPGIGALGQSLGQRAAAGDVTGAITEGAASALAPTAMKEAAPVIKQVAPKLPGIGPYIQNRTPIPGENFTPQQHASLSGVLARGSGVGKSYFPKDVASTIGSPLRQAAADNPGIAQVIQNGSPEDSLAGTQALLSKAQNTIDTQHNAALAPVANTPISMQPVQDAVSFPSSLKGYAPQDAADVANFKQRLGTINTLGDLNDLRMRLAKEDNPTYRQNAIQAGRSLGVDEALHDAYGAVRDHYYDQLQNTTGLDFQGLKRTESGIMSAQEALQNAAPGMAAKEAIAGQPRSLRGTAADIVQGSNSMKGGITAGVGQFVANKVLGETPMTPVQEGLQNFFSNLPKPSTYTGPLTSQWSPAPRSLPASILNNAPTGANQSQTPQTVSTMFSGQGMVPRGAPVVPGIQQPLLGAGQGNPEFVTPPASPPPPVNPATAQTSVYAGTPKPVQPAVPRRLINVSPDGKAAIQRHALPPPHIKPAKKMNETKTFTQASISALPSPIRRVLRDTGATIQPATGNRGGYHEAVASVSPDAPNTIQIEDPERFNASAPQTVAHEAFHVWRNNLPPHIRAMAPQDDTDQNNYADPGTMNRLRAQGKRLWDLPEESGATAVQYYTSQGGENAPKAIRDAYKPWVDDMNTDMSNIEPTPANAQQINTTPRPPGTMYSTRTFAKGEEPLMKGAPVQLPDGTQGRVAHVIANMRSVRVRTDDGRNLTVRLGALKVLPHIQVAAHIRKVPEK